VGTKQNRIACIEWGEGGVEGKTDNEFQIQYMFHKLHLQIQESVSMSGNYFWNFKNCLNEEYLWK
jgi:hypothetical protein